MFDAIFLSYFKCPYRMRMVFKQLREQVREVPTPHDCCITWYLTCLHPSMRLSWARPHSTRLLAASFSFAFLHPLFWRRIFLVSNLEISFLPFIPFESSKTPINTFLAQVCARSLRMHVCREHSHCLQSRSSVLGISVIPLAPARFDTRTWLIHSLILFSGRIYERDFTAADTEF